MIYLFAICLAAAIIAWAVGRPRGFLFPSDVFFIVCVLTTGIVPLLNPRAISAIGNPYEFDQSTVDKALAALAIMYFVFALVWSYRATAMRRLAPEFLFARYPISSEKLFFSQSRHWLWLAAIGVIALTLAFYAYPPFISFKMGVVSFLTGQLPQEVYAEIRRITYARDPVIVEVMGRLRFMVFPVLLVFAFIYVLVQRSLPLAVAAFALLFVLGPASMSKAPIFIYASYAALAWIAWRGWQWPLRTRNLLLSLAVAIPLFTVGLGAVYFNQYPETFRAWTDFPQAVALASFRLFENVYMCLLQWVEVYPERRSFAGIESIALLGDRYPDAEVVEYYYGRARAHTSTFPTIFIGSGYASFGLLGVALYSAIVGLWLLVIDKIFLGLRNRYVRICYYSVMSVNVIFLTTVAAPTAFFTYGVGVIPPMLWLLNRYAFYTKSRNESARPARAPAVNLRLEAAVNAEVEERCSSQEAA